MTTLPPNFKAWPQSHREQWLSAEASRLVAAIEATQPERWAEKPKVDDTPDPRADVLEVANELKSRLDRSDRMSSRNVEDDDV